MLNEKARNWLLQRGIDPAEVHRHGLRSSADGSEIEFPYIVEGREVNCKYRRLDEKSFRQVKGGVKAVWNFDCLLDETLRDSPLYVTEGEMDALVLMQHGISRVISVPDGAPAEAVGEKDSVKYGYLDAVLDLLPPKTVVVLAVDADQAGANLMHDLAIRFGRSSCQYMRYPKDCKDLNDTLVKHGNRGVQACLDRCEWMRVDGVYRMSDLPPAHDAEPHETGIPWLSKHYRMRLGDFCVITGIPSHGKSTFCNQLIASAVQKNGWGACFASFEQHPTLDHKRNLRRMFIGHSHQWTREEIERADHWIDENFCFMVPSHDDDVTLEWVLEKAAVAVTRFDSKIIVIDPWNEMDHIRPAAMSLTEYTGFAIKQLKKFARNYHIHLIVVAHPAKMRRLDDGGYHIPTLYDISDSAHWYNKPDVGIVVHRDGKEKSRIRVAKSRYHDKIGEPGDVEVMLSPTTQRYELFVE